MPASNNNSFIFALWSGFALTTWGQVSWYHCNRWLNCHGLPMSSLYTVKKILPSVSSVAICDDALPNWRNLLISHLFASHWNMPHWYGTLTWPRTSTFNKLENVQRRSARFVKGDYHTTTSVTQMLQELGWQDLQSCRRDLRLTLLYKVVTGHVGIQPEHVGLVAADNRTRVEHQLKFCALGSSTQAYSSFPDPWVMGHYLTPNTVER